MSADRPGAAGAVEPAWPAASRAGNMLDYARRELETFSRRGLCAEIGRASCRERV